MSWQRERNQNAWQQSASNPDLTIHQALNLPSMQPDIRDALENLRRILALPSETAGLDAQVLLAHMLGKPRAWVLAHPEYILSTEQAYDLDRASARLRDGEPLPYLLGHWEFFGLDFEVTPAVLIPRPETELLVQTALDWLNKHTGANLAADVGTGSGCIAVTLAANHQSIQVIAADISARALKIAKRNINNHHLLGQIYLVQSDLLCGISPAGSRCFDLICANLPYIPAETLETLQVGAWEPRNALLGGEDGLDAIRRLLEDIPSKLAPGGLLLLEIEASQGDAARALVAKALPGALIQIIPDLAGYDRLVAVQRTV